MRYEIELEKVTRQLVTYRVEANCKDDAIDDALCLAQSDDPDAEYDVLNIFKEPK